MHHFCLSNDLVGISSGVQSGIFWESQEKKKNLTKDLLTKTIIEEFPEKMNVGTFLKNLRTLPPRVLEENS